MKELQMLTDRITPREIQTSQSLSRRMRIALSFTLAYLSSHAKDLVSGPTEFFRVDIGEGKFLTAG
jgi:hypothetical protein